MQAERETAAQPTSPRLGRSDSKKKLGIFMKRTYAGVNKQTSKVPNPLLISFLYFILLQF
jgi:hypothetical protein